ncbi:MAG: hypothetical protein K2P87_16115 [Lachnospiraceae bacterium]|nr:hypothetical protein [Lachnospiraceae bacterium]
MITMPLKNKKLLTAEELMERSDTLGMAIDVFMIDNVLDNCLYKACEKEYMQRLDLHLREQYPEITAVEISKEIDESVRGIYMENAQNWADAPQEIKSLRFDKIGILYHLAKRDRPLLGFEEYIAELGS